MGGGIGRGLDFGNTWGSGRLPISELEPDAVPEDDWYIGRSLGAAAMNYDIKDPRTGKIYHFVEGTTISQVEVFAGKGTRNKLRPAVVAGLSKRYGGRPRDWKHVKGLGTIEAEGHFVTAEVHWFEERGVGRVEFKVKRWLDQ